jgi:hypothetical protein
MSKITYTNKVAVNENEEIPDINKITDDDMNEIKTVVNNNDDELITTNTNITNITTYSTDEIVVGTWMGKPLYRKIINMTLPGSAVSSWTNVTGSPTDISVLVKVYGSASNNAPLPLYESTSYYVLFSCVGESRLKYRMAGYTNVNIRVAIEYTKTTD